MPSLKAEYEQHQKLQVDDLRDHKVERDLSPRYLLAVSKSIPNSSSDGGEGNGVFRDHSD